jgi:hypothetical protein
MSKFGRAPRRTNVDATQNDAPEARRALALEELAEVDEESAD